MSAEAAMINQMEMEQLSVRERVANFAHSAVDAIRDRKKEILLAGSSAALVLGPIACASDGSEGNPGTTGGTTPGTEQVSTTVAGIPGDVTPGDDATIAAENAEGRYECGGAKNYSWTNPDGTPKPFTADVSLIPHMNANKDLAVSDQNWHIDLMGEAGFKYLAVNAYSNNSHDEVNSDLNVPETTADYEDFIEKQVSTVVQEDAVVENNGCLMPDGSYKVHAVGLKHIMAGRTSVTGLVLSNEKFPGFVEAVAADGKDLDDMLIQDVDTNGDKVNDAKHIATKLRECENNFTLTDIAPPVPVEETPPATGGPTTRPGQPTTTRPGQPTTTPPATRPELGVTPDSSVVDGPGVGGNPDDNNERRDNTTTSTTNRPATSTTTQAPVPTITQPPTTNTTVIAG